jgi:hypothetical protein
MVNLTCHTLQYTHSMGPDLAQRQLQRLWISV